MCQLIARNIEIIAFINAYTTRKHHKTTENMQHFASEQRNIYILHANGCFMMMYYS